MRRRRRDHVATLRARVEVITKHLGLALDVRVEAEVVMESLRSALDRRRAGHALSTGEFCEVRSAIVAVYIENSNARGFAGRNADAAPRILRPPSENLRSDVRRIDVPLLNGRV